MAKSRKRRPRRSHADPRSQSLQHKLAVLRRADAAELRGDAEAALDIIESNLVESAFWASWRVRRLCVLVLLGPWLPRWATSRWILAQALIHLGGSPGGIARQRVHRALAIAIELQGGPEHLPGSDTLDARTLVMDHDWVYRQLHLYELGGLAHFLDRVAPADLLAGADRIREWASTPMGAFRLLARDAGTVVWADLASGDTVHTANIGSAVLVIPGECVIGRMVPIDDGVMFEGAPLLVPQPVAQAVAEDPAGWLEALRSAQERRRDIRTMPLGGDVHGLLTDVPPTIWMPEVFDLAGVTGHVPMPSDEQRVAAFLDLAALVLESHDSWPLDDPEALDPWACLSAAVLDPVLFPALATSTAGVDPTLLARLGDLLAEPAASVCRDVAAALRDVA